MKYSWIILFLLAASCSEPVRMQFTELSVPADPGSGEPNLMEHAGSVYLSWIDSSLDTARLLFSEYRAGQWSESRLIAEGDDWFVNWADFPSLLVTDEYKVAHYLEKSSGSTFAYDVKLKIGEDSWSEPFKLNRDTVKGEHGFVELFALDNGNFGACWLDGRNMTGSHGMGGGAMNLRFAELDRDGNFIEDRVLDHRTCECCQTASTVMGDVILVAYRDRSDDEIRDIYLARYANGNWEEPTRIHADDWKIPGCPVNGPFMSSSGDNACLAWYTAPNEKGKVRFISSSDRGKTWEESVRVDNGDPIGRVSSATLPNGTHLISWIEDLGEQAMIRLKAFKGGQLLDSADVADISTSRSSGFPVMAVRQDSVFVTWTETGTDLQVKMAAADIRHLQE